MPSSLRFSLPDIWWKRAGERIILGIDIRRVLDGKDASLPGRARDGLLQVNKLIEQGCGIHDALRSANLKLPDELWYLLAAGERGGRLGESMVEVGESLSEFSQRKRQVLGQIWYPTLVVFTGFLVMGIILLWVVPQLREITHSFDKDQALPWITEHIGLIYGTVFLSGSVSLLLITASFTILRALSRTSSNWADKREIAFSFIPVLRGLRFRRREARILRQLGILLNAGIALPEALSIAAGNSLDKWEQHQLQDFRKRLLLGSALEDCIRAFLPVSPDSINLLLIGQENGKLDTYMIGKADELDQNITWEIQHYIRLLEPLTLLFLCAAIGGLLLAYILPVIRLLDQLA